MYYIIYVRIYVRILVVLVAMLAYRKFFVLVVKNLAFKSTPTLTHIYMCALGMI